MKLSRVLLIVLIPLLILTNSELVTAQVIDGAIAREQLKRTVKKMLYQGRFGDLEIMANQLRKTKAKFPEGTWKLLFFYEAFGSPLDKSPEGWKRFLAKFDKWLQFTPNSVTAKVAAGTAWLAYGWEARGTGYASSVSEEGWSLFKERMQKSYDLVSKKPSRPTDDCPGRYDLLLLLAMAQGWDRPQYDALFHEAISFEPGYHALYHKKADYLTPRWHGEKGEWQKFAKEAVKLTPPSEGNTIYARLLVYFWQDEYKSFDEPGISWSLVKQGYQDIERNHPGSPWNLNQFCRLACSAKDKETAKVLFDKIGNHPYWKIWKAEEYERCQTLLGIKKPKELVFNPWLETEDFRQLLQLAKDGDADAQYQVGQAYYDCGSTEYCAANDSSTYQEAVKWFTKASEQGHAQAQLYLTSLYSSGMGGIKPDLKEALKWNKAAAYQGYSGAAFSLGVAYYWGDRGAPQDLVKAFVWFDQMANEHSFKKEIMDKLTPEQLKEAELEAKQLKLQILKNKEEAEAR